MRNLLLLAGSIAVNVTLGFLVFSSSGGTAVKVPMARVSGIVEPSSRDKIAAAEPVDPPAWSKLGTGDTAAVAARLRAEGFPPLLQRAMLKAVIRERFADRHQELNALIAGGEWWRDNFIYTANNAKIRMTRRQLEHDEREALDALLDSSAGLTAYQLARQAQRYGERVPLAKSFTLDRITDDYTSLQRDIEDGVMDFMRPEDQAKVDYLAKQEKADIEKLLTPDEREEYALHTSPATDWLADRLSAFDPSEDEFRAIFKIHEASVAQANGPTPLTEEQRRVSDAAQLMAALSPERYAEFQVKTEPAYLDAHAVVERLQLPEGATADVVAVKKDIAARANAYQHDDALSADERNSRLAALAAEAVARLTPTLGDTGVTAYLNHGGYWIQQLKTPPASPPGGPKH